MPRAVLLVCAMAMFGPWSVPNAYADIGSIGALLLFEKQVSHDLNVAMSQLGAAALATAGSAASTLDTTAEQLRSLVGGDINRQISQLSGAAHDLAVQLANTVEATDQMLKIRTRCGLEGADRLVYGIRTLSAQLQAAVPLVQAAKPFLSSFVYEGHVPGVVPATFGRVLVQGAQLWRDDTTPEVSLVTDRHDSIVAKLAHVEKGNDSDSVSFVVSPAMASGHTGSCLDIKVVPHHTEHTILGLFGTKVVADDPLYLPMCVPAYLGVAYNIDVTEQDECHLLAPQETELPIQVAHCLNASCEGATACAQAPLQWAIPDTCQVTGFRDEPGGLTRGTTSVIVQWANLGNGQERASVSGTLDTADCFMSHMNHPTEWQRVLAPRIRCDQVTWRTSENKSNDVALSMDTQPVCVRTTHACASKTIAISATVGIQPAGTLRQPAPMKTVVLKDISHATFETVTFEHMTITGDATVNAPGGQSETCVNVSVSSCDY